MGHDDVLDRSMDRKTFLREAPAVLLRAVAQGAREARPPAPEPPVPLLRPPGAAPEEQFLELCCGIGACAAACPADAIQLRPREDDPSRLAPIVVPDEAPCVVCEELACMAACPSGALTPTTREAIRIGRARVSVGACLSWEGVDLDCNYCVDRCPLGVAAIAMEKTARGKGPRVKDGCIGCGVCEYYCPTDPAAIRVFEREPS
ncbi:MAG: 4Fe-4S dicluster domain-containing protein [Candidatus Methylomirabilales bacterium]